jgi:TonB family protein
MSSHSGMFAPVEPGGGWLRGWVLLFSFGLHVAAITLLLHDPEPGMLKGAVSLRGNGGRGAALMTIYLPGESIAATPKKMEPERQERRIFPNPSKKTLPPVVESKVQPPTTDSSLSPGMSGYILGSLSDGFANDHDVHIALTLVAPDPPIVRAKLPEWIRGDVIVEITIDERGNVVQTRVLQTVGYGLEVVVVDTLRQWRFAPAKVDGVAVASRQDVHFHFPS